MYLRLLICFLLSSGVVACGTTIDDGYDAGPPPPSGQPTELALLTPGSLQLVFGAQADFAVRYTRSDRSPIAGATIDLGLVGRADDSTLTALSVVTDADGVANGSVIAGTHATAFRIRIGAERAADRFIDVSVSDLGFGALSIATRHVGDRPVARRAIHLFADTACDDESVRRAVGVRSGEVLEDDEELEIGALPVGVTYAVVVRGASEAMTDVAYGCVDGLEVVADDVSPVWIEIDDLPLDVSGSYDAVVSLDTSASALHLADGVRAAARPLFDRGDAAFLLDAIDTMLREGGDADAAASIARLRASTELDSDLADALALAGAGPTAALDDLASGLAEQLSRLQVEGELALGMAGLPGWRSRTITLAGDAEIRPPLVLDLRALGVELGGAVRATAVADADALQVRELTVTLPLGQLADLTLDAIARDRGGDDATSLDLLRARGGCEQLQLWAASRDGFSEHCDDACVAAACELALAGLLSAVGDAFDVLDEDRAFVALSGRATLEDLDQDLRPDTLEVPALVGRWTREGATEGDSVSGAAMATRVTALP